MSSVNKVQVDDTQYDIEDAGAVRFDTTQQLTSDQKTAARTNIGAYAIYSSSTRPTGVGVGYMMFDTTLGKPIWYDGIGWVDSTGAAVT